MSETDTEIAEGESCAAMLAREAQDFESYRDKIGPMHRSRPAREPAQVYSVRMPVDKLEELRRQAAEAGITPSALLRKWALEHLTPGSPQLPEDCPARVSELERVKSELQVWFTREIGKMRKSAASAKSRELAALQRRISRSPEGKAQPKSSSTTSRTRRRISDPAVLQARREALAKARETLATKRKANREASAASHDSPPR